MKRHSNIARAVLVFVGFIALESAFVWIAYMFERGAKPGDDLSDVVCFITGLGLFLRSPRGILLSLTVAVILAALTSLMCRETGDDT